MEQYEWTYLRTGVPSAAAPLTIICPSHPIPDDQIVVWTAYRIVTERTIGTCTVHSQKRIMKAFAFTKPHDFRVFTKEDS